jgi:hypothetical protein
MIKLKITKRMEAKMTNVTIKNSLTSQFEILEKTDLLKITGGGDPPKIINVSIGDGEG